MHEEDITQLYKKINELKFNYEVARQSRIDLVKTMELLDQRLSELEEELKETEINIQNEQAIKIKNIRIITSCLIRIILSFLISFIIVAGVGIIFFKDVSNLPFISIIMLLINTASNITPILVNGKIIKKTKSRSIEEIEDEYQKTLEKRISEGQKYKSVREEEVLTEKVYKVSEKTLTEQIAYMEANNKRCSSTPNIDTKDIYSSIKLDSSFMNESVEEKKEILDEELRKYLSKKVSESFYDVLSPEDLKLFTSEELVKILASQIQESKRQEKLSHIIHAILNFVGTIQEYGVVWYEETNEALTNNPEIIFDEQGRWTELKTHKNTNYEMLFNTVYNVFINEVMKTSENKKRTR